MDENAEKKQQDQDQKVMINQEIRKNVVGILKSLMMMVLVLNKKAELFLKQLFLLVKMIVMKIN